MEDTHLPSKLPLSGWSNPAGALQNDHQLAEPRLLRGTRSTFMPLYEYFCPNCDGVFETLRSMRESSESAFCPLCDGASDRIMPTSFSAFTYRDGSPRVLPDTGSYWHFDKKVKTMNTGGVPATQHPELYQPAPPAVKSRGEKEVERDVNYYKQRHARRMKDSDLRGPVLKADGQPLLSPKMGA